VNKESVNEAFRELQSEFGSSRRREAKGARRIDWVSLFDSLEDPNNDPFRSTVVDKKTAKKWIDKAFDFAFEFNEDFTTAQGEKDATEEFLRKSRDWVSRFYDEDQNAQHQEEEKKAAKNDDNGDSSSSKSPSENDVAEDKSLEHVKEPAVPIGKNNQIVSETPDSEDRSDRDIFCVSIDLPGVDKTNVDITIDGDILLIRAKRNASSTGLPIRVYAKELAFPKNVEVEKLEANLKNGVLIVSAPTLKPIEGIRKIQVN